MKSHSKKIEAAFRVMEKSNATLLTLAIPAFQEVYPATLQRITSRKNGRGILISFNKSFLDIKSVLTQGMFQSKNLFIIDAVTSKEECKTTDKQLCLVGPEALTELSIRLTELMKTGNFNYVVFDNLSAFLIHNDPETAKRFVHYLLAKIRYFDLKAIFLIFNDKKSKELYESIAPFFDRSVRV